jgi:fatty-acyl-CoA synthase
MEMIGKTLRCVREVKSLEDVVALESVEYDELVPARRIYDLFLATAALHGDRPAITVLRSADPDDVDVSYTHQELLEEITRAANLFTSLGVGEHDVVAIASKTYGIVPAVMWGASVAGIVSTLNYFLAPEVLLELLTLEKARVLVCPGPSTDPDLWRKLSSIIDKVPTLEHVLVIGGEIPDRRCRDLHRELAVQEPHKLVSTRKIERDTLASYFHTGGTTGSPKLVPQTHGNQIHSAWCFAQSLGTTETDIAINGLPFFHVGGVSPWALAILAAGAHTVILSPVGYRDPDVVRNVWRIVEHFGVTLFGAVPTTIGALENVPLGGADISSLRLVLTGGAAISPSVANRFEKLVGVPLIEQYGMTETAAAMSCTPVSGRRYRGSVGLRHPFMDLQVVRDPSVDPMEECPAGETGTVVCRGRQIVSSYANPKHNEGSFNAAGWLITGDVGHFTEDAQLVLTGRKKDLIIRSGHNLDPAAIEEVANIYPGVATSAAIGMPDAYAGEVPVLFVTAKPDSALVVEDLARHMERRIAEPPARPRHIFVLGQLPLTAVGKVFKPALREMAISEKLRMEAAKADAGFSLSQITFGNDGTAVALMDARGRSSGTVEARARFEKAIGDLTVRIGVNWLGD